LGEDAPGGPEEENCCGLSFRPFILAQEREEKLRLQSQIKRLWEDNQRLQEESQTSAAKLKKFTEWVFNTIDMN
ncbi:Signal-induced proliferation-associated 1-like protein 1, partial [Xenoophorus captivus]